MVCTRALPSRFKRIVSRWRSCWVLSSILWLRVACSFGKSCSGHSTLYNYIYLHRYISITPERGTNSPGPASSSACHLSCWCLFVSSSSVWNWVPRRLFEYLICERKPGHALLGGGLGTWWGEEDQVGHYMDSIHVITGPHSFVSG